MILIKEIALKRFRNLNVELKNLRDLNILIGPNNCGKTNLLEALGLLSQLSHGQLHNYLCRDCEQLRRNVATRGTESNTATIYVGLMPQDYYKKAAPKDEEVEVSLLLDRKSVEKLVPRILGKQDKRRESACPKAEDRIILRNKESALYAVHFSPFLHADVLDEIKQILYCPEARLQNYKGKDFASYLREKQFSGAAMRRLIDLLAKVVDPKIHDYKLQDLIRTIEGSDLTVSIAEQGSGVRSLVCLAADILADTKSKIILVDEPELGLNPSARQELLGFLSDEARDRQIFVATQDPCFVNPAIWRRDANTVSIQLFSLQTNDFVNVDLFQNEEDSSVFAGYLPHTTSLRRIHLYVEGSSDVYIFQVWLRKFLRDVEKHDAEAVEVRTPGVSTIIHHAQYDFGDRFEIENEIGIFHLCGDFWCHLLYTVPRRPYRCIVILDGDKRELVPDVIRKHNESGGITPNFKLAESIDAVAATIRDNRCHPIYCLEKNKIEDYLGSITAQYNKKVDGPRLAEQLDLPAEIFNLFRVLLEETKRGSGLLRSRSA
jgi:predicted ATPase